MTWTPCKFLAELADEVILHRSPTLHRIMSHHRFRSSFGVSPHVCSWYWNKLSQQKLLPERFEPKHFLWTLLFLKLYCSEAVNASLCDCDEKMGMDWHWCHRWSGVGKSKFCHSWMKFLYLYLMRCQIDWENRNMNDNGSICKITLDATDFRTCKTSPFDPKWYSHKFRGPGLHYEVGVCIQTAWIVWIHGPFPPGHWPDIMMHAMPSMMN